jgi:Mg-chelatase subunit ChlD
MAQSFHIEASEKKVGLLLTVLLDCSGSMYENEKMEAALESVKTIIEKALVYEN